MHDPAVAAHVGGDLLGRGEAHHVAPPDVPAVVHAGAEPRPLQAVHQALRRRQRPVRLGRDRVPDVVHVLAHGVAVVDAVVPEHPGLVDVLRRQHRELADHVAEALALEERAVGGVVADDEQPADDRARHHPERQQQQRRIERDERGDQEAVDRDVAREVRKPQRRRVLVHRVREDLDDLTDARTFVGFGRSGSCRHLGHKVQRSAGRSVPLASKFGQTPVASLSYDFAREGESRGCMGGGKAARDRADRARRAARGRMPGAAGGHGRMPHRRVHAVRQGPRGPVPGRCSATRARARSSSSARACVRSRSATT